MGGASRSYLGKGINIQKISGEIMADEWLREKVKELKGHSDALESAPAYSVVSLARKAGVCVAEITAELARRELLRNE